MTFSAEKPVQSWQSKAITQSLLRSLSATAIGIVSASVLGRSLGVSGYGLYQLVANLAAQIGQLCEAGVGTAIIALRKTESAANGRVVRMVLVYFVSLAIPTLLLSSVFTLLLVDNVWWMHVATCGIISLATFSQFLIIGLFRFFGETKLANSVMLLPAGVNLLVIGILWQTGLLTPLVALAALAASQTITLIVSGLWLRTLIRTQDLPTQSDNAPSVGFGDLFRTSWKSSVTRISQLLIYRLDLFLLAYLIGEESLGLYVPAVFLASQLNHVGDAVGFVLYPSVARSEMSSVHAADACRILMLLSCALAVAISLTGTCVLWVIWGSAFEAAYTPLLYLLPGYVALTPAKALSAYLAVETRFHATMKASLSGLSINTIVNLLLIPELGVIGAAIATSMALIAVSILLTRDFCQATGLSISRLWIPRSSDLRRLADLIVIMTKIRTVHRQT